jgi:deoxycytidylate deaminase
MYLSCGVPCADCARGIINSGITRIFCERGQVGAKGIKWAESAERSWEMFDEAGVEVCFYDEPYHT